MKKSKIIALSSITCAFIVIIITVGAYFPTFDVSALFLASLAIMLPLSKKSYFGAILAIIASSVLTLFISGFRYQIVVPYAMFFGWHAVINYFVNEKKINRWIALAVKDIWFILTIVLMQIMSEVIAIDIEALRPFIYPILIVGGGALFIIYDLIMIQFQVYVDSIIKRLKV